MPAELKISQVALYKLFIPLKEPFVISLGPIPNAENVLVVIHTEQGITGFGECSPFMSINGESMDTCFIVGQYFAKLFKGNNALAIEDRIADMDKLIYGNSSIKSAFDMALYDIASQHAGVPLYKFLGGSNNKTIITDYTVSIGEPEKMAADAVKIKEEGYPAIKIKLGKNGAIDVLRIKAIREAVGDEIPLRIDANQGWDVEEAISTLRALAPFNIQHCEEPIPRWDFMRLPEVRKESPIPIMSDESCGDEHDAKRLIQLGACDYMNIKLGKSGGIFKALKMVKLAKAAKLHLQVGAFMESRLAMTAFAHFSLCSPIIEHFDFDTALMFSEDPVTGGIVYEKNGVVRVPEVAGLGASVDSNWLNKLEKAIV
ncbi:mandelate racemase/muconate lactonizing enzyme family protein [Terrimonas alba]|uniref:mandelate racemase/muconate lactonizing enzyme family protein n=1 Tax=Terrimonas alba TaxID=3349636 RepID=UPI0035F3F9C7